MRLATGLASEVDQEFVPTTLTIGAMQSLDSAVVGRGDERMALYEIHPDSLELIPATSFADEGVYERQDLQRLLRDQPEVLGEPLFVVAEEFGDWEDSRRRIDLLALDQSGDLVVIELKRTEDAGHAELQAIRYAAMVSTMTLSDIVRGHAGYLGQRGLGGDAHERILDFLPNAQDEPVVNAGPPRIIVASQDFSKELTATVLWLNNLGLDIRCVRLTPHRIESRLLVNVEQVLPLPEAEEYMVRARLKDAERRESRQAATERNVAFQRFFAEVLGRFKERAPGVTSATRTQPQNYFTFGAGARSGMYFAWSFKGDGRLAVELTVDTEEAEENSRVIAALRADAAILESEVGAALEWDVVPDRRAQRVAAFTEGHLFDGTPDQVESMTAWAVATMDSLVRSLQPRLQSPAQR